MKTFKTTLLTIAVLLYSISASAHDFGKEGIYYNITSETLLTVGVTYYYYSESFTWPAYSGTVIIPNSVEYNGQTYSVTSIGYNAFGNCSSLTSVTIPNSVTSIGDNAFYNCSDLTSIIIPNSITSIGYKAFYECTNLETVINCSNFDISKGSSSHGYVGYYANKVINTEEQIGDFFFETNNGVHSLVAYIGNESNLELPVNYKGENYEIGYEAFYKCSSLTSVIIPNSVTSIGGSAFYNCSGLTSLTIPNSVTSIGDKVFYGCSSLTSITIPNSVTSIGGSAFYNCSGLTSLTIPNSVTSIGGSAFYNCSGLTSITIPNSVTSIGGSTFYNCSGLTSLTIPNSVTSIGEYAFYGCSNLSNLTYGAKNLDLDDFDDSPLKTLTIGAEVTTITGYINNSPAKTIWLTNTPPTGYTRASGKINYAANEQYTALSNVEVYPYLSSMFDVDGVKYVPVDMAARTCDAISCNYDSTAADVTIAPTVSFKGVEMKVREVMPYTFYGNDFVRSVSLNHAGNIGESAFYDCDSIKSIDLSNLGNIRKTAFYSCDALEAANIEIISSAPDASDNITFSDWISTIYYFSNTSSETYTFTITKESTLSFGWWITRGACYGRLSVSLDGKEILYKSVPDEGIYTQIVNKGTHTLVFEHNGNSYLDYNNHGGDEVKIFNINVSANGGESIAKEAFKDCSLLKTLTLGERILSFGESVFSGCSSLQEVVIPNSVTEIGNYCFQNCSGLGSVELGNKLSSIGTYAFSGCSSLANITIPQSVTNVSDYTFWNCSSLADVIIENRTGALTLGSNGSSPLFADCPLDSVYIGGKISYNTSSDKGYSPFYRNTSLRSVVIGDKEEAVYDNEFYGCTALKNVSIGNGVTTIGDWAFSGCSSLESFAFGKNVASIGQEAFSDCTNMTQLTSLATVPPTCGTQALDDINKWNCTLKVIEGSKAAYQTADQWRDFFFLEEVSSIKEVLAGTHSTPIKPVDVYTLQGVRIKTQIPVETLEEELPVGIYIVNGKKMIVR